MKKYIALFIVLAFIGCATPDKKKDEQAKEPDKKEQVDNYGSEETAGRVIDFLFGVVTGLIDTQ